MTKKSKSSLLEVFNIERKSLELNNVTDYEVFEDKQLLDDLRTKIVENLIDKDMPEDKDLNEFINEEIDATVEGYDLTNLERSHLFHLIDNEINGYGPITELLNSKNVTEIMINSPREIFVEIDSQIVKDESVSFINDDHIIRTIQRLIEPLGKTIDHKNPMVDARLFDGSRINAVIPPLSTKGPVVTIRKFRENLASIDDFIRSGSLTPYMARFLEAAVRSKLNIIICGGADTGKSNLLNILGGFIPEHERIITIEESAELRLKQEHVISLEARVLYDQDGEITMQDLIRGAIRMRPDRIIVGEVKGKETFDILQAMNTGHDGSITTLHASSASDALHRIETMVYLSGVDLPPKAIREYILSAIDLVVCMERMSDGKRKVTSIAELKGLKEDHIETKEIFTFVENGLTETSEVDGSFKGFGKTPAIYKKMNARGVNDIKDIF